MANMEMRMIRSFETIDRDHRGFGTASALMTIIQSLAVWPGRKTIVYFSEGLPASPVAAGQARFGGQRGQSRQRQRLRHRRRGPAVQSTLSETRREMDMAGRRAAAPDGTSRDPTEGR